MSRSTRNRNENLELVNRSYDAPANYPSSNYPAQMAEAYSLAEFRNDASAKLYADSMGNYTMLEKMCDVIDEICPQATEVNRSLARGYAYKAFRYSNEWDEGF